MDQLDRAIHETAHNSVLSAQEMARALGISHQIFLNKTNPTCEQNKLSFREGFAMILHSGKRDIIDVMIRAYVDMWGGGEPVDLLTAVLSAGSEQGDVERAIKDALGDGVINSREQAHIRQQITEAREALGQLEAAVDAKSKDSLVDLKPTGVS